MHRHWTMMEQGRDDIVGIPFIISYLENLSRINQLDHEGIGAICKFFVKAVCQYHIVCTDDGFAYDAVHTGKDATFRGRLEGGFMRVLNVE